MPEIAQKYLTDYDDYCEAAKLYTKRYATRERPDEKDLIFLDDEMDSENGASTVFLPLTMREPEADSISVQQSLREIYDEHFPMKSISLNGRLLSAIRNRKLDLPTTASPETYQAQKAMKIYENSIEHVTVFAMSNYYSNVSPP